MRNYLKKKLNKKGFTPIELIVVIAILAILALILVTSISNYVSEANKSKDLANVRSVYSQLTAEVSMAKPTDTEVTNDKWGFKTNTNGVVKGEYTVGTGKPSGIDSVTYSVKDGVVDTTTFKAVIGSDIYESDAAGEVKLKTTP